MKFRASLILKLQASISLVFIKVGPLDASNGTNGIPYSCPPVGQGPSEALQGSTHYDIQRAGPNEVCIMASIKKSDQIDFTDGSLKPIARSYSGYPWEASAGAYVDGTLAGLDCTTAEDGEPDDTSTCTLTTPPVSNEEEIVLISYEAPPASDKDQVSQFLERATFGPTQAELDSWDYDTNFDGSFAQWMHQQLDEPMTLHRAYFRERVKGRAKRRTDQVIGLADRPCDAQSHWRTYAFAWEEWRTHQRVDVQVSPGSDDYFLLSINGIPRTEVLASDWDNVIAGFSYRICFAPDEYVGGSLSLLVNHRCREIETGNPPIQFPSVDPASANQLRRLQNGNAKKYDHSPLRNMAQSGPSFVDQLHVLQLPELTQMRSSDQNNFFLLRGANVSTCEELSRVGSLPVHAVDAAGRWYLHDPRIKLQDNSQPNPDSDGGLQVQLSSNRNITWCHYVPRSPAVDSDTHCAISRVPDICGKKRHTYDMNERGPHMVVCASPGEVGNGDLKLNNSSKLDMAMDARWDHTVSQEDFEAQKISIWTTVSVYARDQLRQRVAWALSQIMAMVVADVKVKEETEPFLAYHDIFVRHAFGNYRDILGEVAYSPAMAEMLTYLHSKSTAHMADAYDQHNVYPDENFAREVLQLFTIGLYKLNMDGTFIMGSNRETPEHTYTIDDIMEGARCWTGMHRQFSRGNVEDPTMYFNRIDPMQMIPTWRDPFPKMGLNGQHVGEGYPLCEDLPPMAFLKQGAKYRYLGSHFTPELQTDPSWWEHNPHFVHVDLDPSNSALYAELCQGDDGLDCQFEMEVALEVDLPCFGKECNIDQPRVVKVGDIFYEYVRRPCVQWAFYPSPLKIKQRSFIDGKAFCANPKLPVAGEICQPPDQSSSSRGVRNCEYVGERMTYDRAQGRCEDIGSTASSIWRHFGSTVPSDCGVNSCCLMTDGFFWSSSPCEVLFKVDESSSKVAMIHNHTDWDDDYEMWNGMIPDSLSAEHAQSFFAVHWKDGQFPSDSHCHGDCHRALEDSSCICRANVEERVVFNDMPTHEEATQQLTVGAAGAPPSECRAFQTSSDGRVEAFNCDSENSSFDRTTIFKVSMGPGRSHQFYRNINSFVVVNSGSFEFRNPPHFVSIAEPELRDINDEIDAVLDQYVYHPNVPPFLATRLIQRFGTSNPSPRYTKTVATAFQHGVYTDEASDITFGSNKYGCMEATVAAVLLDREVQSTVLSMDPSSGSIREPLIRLTHVLRALEYQDAGEGVIKTSDAITKIGQMAHAIPSVFSFFLSDYAPPGRISKGGLKSPEAQKTNTPTIIGLVDGLFSLVKYGLSECNGGLGPINKPGHCATEENNTISADKAIGHLTWEPSSINSTVNELSTLLTAGRLARDPAMTQMITDTAIEDGNGDLNQTIRIAQQLILASPEFHTTAGRVARVSRHSPSELNSTLPDSGGSSSGNETDDNEDYKAIVYFFMNGGVDSYNLLVPDFRECASLFDKYTQTRGSVALAPNELGGPISDGGQQPDGSCGTFRLNKEVPDIEQLYNEGDVLFAANTGFLITPIGSTEENDWSVKHADTALFAHDVQMREVKQLDPLLVQAGTGILGRMVNVLNDLDSPFVTGSTSIESTAEALNGDGVNANTAEGHRPSVQFLSKNGGEKFDEFPSSSGMNRVIEHLNDQTDVDSNVYADTWSTLFLRALDENKDLHEIMDTTDLSTHPFTGSSPDEMLSSRGIALKKMEMISKLIKAHNVRGKERDVFFVEMPGWDSHSNAKVQQDLHLGYLNDAVQRFANELKGQGNWDKVTLVMASEFGRSLTPNTGKGTDHGWGGNYFIAGGSVRGGQIVGTYPNDYDAVDVGRGRLFPTTSWDSLWYGIAQWFGVTRLADLSKVLPNHDRFSHMLSQHTLFEMQHDP